MTVVAIINPVSGAGADPEAASRRIALLERHLKTRSIDARIVISEYAGHARALAVAACADRASLVIAWGGDGTANEVGSVLMNTPTSFAIVPSGSGNGLAAALGLPRSPDAAIDVALSGLDRAIDVGEIGGRPFFNIAGIGFDAAIARRFNARAAGRRGMGPYVSIGVHEAFTYEAGRYRIALDGELIESTALLVAFANGQDYGNRVTIAPHARIDDGRLDAVIVEDRGVLDRLWSGRHLAFGTAARARGVTFRSVTRAEIASDTPMMFHVDGEVGAPAECLRICVHPASLRVRVPREGKMA
jgi:YegS/Rv2252/BmrU family lipid kinase